MESHPRAPRARSSEQPHRRAAVWLPAWVKLLSRRLDAATGRRRKMQDMLLALSPSMLAAVFFFGWHALLLLALSCAACILSEHAFCRKCGRPDTTRDLSAAVTGILLAMLVPANFPPLLLLLGDFAAILLVKQCFGGYGHHPVNPALAAWILLAQAFPGALFNWPAPFSSSQAHATTLLEVLNSGSHFTLHYWKLFLGQRGGNLGETCALTLLLGFAFLLYRRVLTPTIPVVYLGSAFVFSLLLGRGGFPDLLSGSLLLGALFLAGDPATSPTSRGGQIFYALGCGILTVFLRKFCIAAEGVPYAIVLMNLITPLLERKRFPTHPSVKREELAS